MKTLNELNEEILFLEKQLIALRNERESILVSECGLKIGELVIYRGNRYQVSKIRSEFGYLNYYGKKIKKDGTPSHKDNWLTLDPKNLTKVENENSNSK